MHNIFIEKQPLLYWWRLLLFSGSKAVVNTLQKKSSIEHACRLFKQTTPIKVWWTKRQTDSQSKRSDPSISVVLCSWNRKCVPLIKWLHKWKFHIEFIKQMVLFMSLKEYNKLSTKLRQTKTTYIHIVHIHNLLSMEHMQYRI